MDLRAYRISFQLIALMVCCAMIGCGDMPATVSGKVTVEGKTYKGLRVTFIPISGGASVSGKTKEDGIYSLRTGKQTGLVPGDYKVTVTGFSKTPSPTMTAAEVNALRIIPEESSNRETTPHKCTVVPGSNEYDLKL